MTLRIIQPITLLALVVLQSACGTRGYENKEHLNRLAQASSPYLKEHADNPVDWYEWDIEALQKAKRENKPLIISIGYASCHWCHVMEKESFMDTSVARIMNKNFVSIKIDREERPDIDQIYIDAAQLISGNAGWPLNAFALPDGKPFYVATYFPKDQWVKVLQQIIDAYQNDNANVRRQAEAITQGIQVQDFITLPETTQQNYKKETYLDIFANWQSSIDFKSGGLSGSPKFPMPVVWEFLLQNHYLTGNKSSLEAVYTSLDEMAKGGIYDQLAGGFSRYATDSLWKVPHFEKMLYDNAQLVSLYSHAYQQSKNPMYEAIVNETLEFVAKELTSPDGGFYSSLNADSEGEEGKYYVWTKAEVEDILPKNIAELFIAYYNVTDSGNWEHSKNILYREITLEDFASKKGIAVGEWERKLKEAQQAVLSVRNKRIHPSLDDKVLTSWNALMLMGYVDAYFATGNKEYLNTALKNAGFLKSKMHQENGKLWRVYNGGKASIEAFLEDYALLAKAYTRVYEATFDAHWLEQAHLLTEYAIQNFRDTQSGLFYFTSGQSENLVARKMELIDNVIPSSNSILAETLYRLGEYYDKDSYRAMARSMLNQVVNDIPKNGPYYANWGSLMGLIVYQPYEVAVMGDAALEKSFLLQQNYLPMAIFMGGEKENLPLLESKLVRDKTIIYVCRNKVCKLPVQDVKEALQQFN